MRAVAEITGSARGTLYLVQEPHGVWVYGRLTGLTPGHHGFHVHDLSAADGCDAAGEHYNPTKRQHGYPWAPERHAGDLGNIWADHHGVANVSVVDSGFRLRDAVGRSLVVHDLPDDGGLGPWLDSRTTGHSGGRVGCGTVIFQ